MQAQDARPTTSTMPVRAAYGQWADTCDTAAKTTRDLDAAVLGAAGLPLDGQAVIETGAGTGKSTAYLAAHARAVMVTNSKGLS